MGFKICMIRFGTYDDVRVRKEALALRANGYKVDFICACKENEKKRMVINGINIYRIPMKRSRAGISRYLYEYLSFFCLASIKLCSLHFKKKYDVIQINTLPDFLVFVALIPKILKSKVILDLHEPAPELFGTIFRKDKKLLMKLITFFEKISIAYADRAITVSKQMKLNYIRRGASPDKIDVVLNVPNLEFNPDAYKEGIQKGNGKFLLVCHGAIMERYGQDLLIKAIKIVKDKIPNIQCKILGYGPYESTLKQLVQKLNLNDYVKFCGYLPFLDVVKTIATCDIGIVPVRKNAYSDLVHTNKMFEFVAMKKPVIISRTNAVEDFFGHDDSCLKYFESGNEKELAQCIIELYHNPEKRKMLAANAFSRFESVDWKISNESYCNIYKEILIN